MEKHRFGADDAVMVPEGTMVWVDGRQVPAPAGTWRLTFETAAFGNLKEFFTVWLVPGELGKNVHRMRALRAEMDEFRDRYSPDTGSKRCPYCGR